MTSITGTKSDDTITTGTGNDIIDGGNGNDTISSGAGDDTVDGGNGNDTIDAGSGNDTVDGGSGNDTINAGTGNDTVDGGSGNDIIDAGDGNDTVLGDSGDDVIRGGIGDDRLYGDSGNDSIDGGAGNDYIDGGSGQDRLYGGAGNDIIIGSTGADTIYGGEGDDVIGRMDDESRCSSGGENGTDVIYGDGYNSAANAGLAAALGNDTIYAGNGNDIIYGDNGNNLSGAGAGGNDRIYAGSGNDQVYGEGGDDTLYGEGGDDVLDGGAGNDTLNGGDGRDTVYGGLGNDTISGADGRDLLYGGSGDDRIGSNGDSGWRHGDQFESGGDTIYGDGKDSATGPAAATGADLIYSGRGNDLIYGDNGDNLSGTGVGGNDIIYAGSGNDVVYGEGGDDQLFGEKGQDRLHGGAGADELAGGLGADTLTGGSGADTFVFTAAINQNDTHGVHHHNLHGYGHQRGHDHDNLLNWSDSTIGSMDVITDFQGIKDLSAQGFTSGADKIDLVQLLGDSVDLKWGGTTPIANGVWFKHIDGDTYVYADINGNTTPELAVRLTGIHHLVVGDFLGVESRGPVASNDGNGSDLVIEAGGLANALAGDSAATGNVLANDTDPDLPFDTLAVSAVNGAAALVGALVVGTYGSLTLNADGSYSYQLDNDDLQTQGLAQGVAATDVFTYTVTDSAGVTAVATLTINITGSNDYASISDYEAGAVVEDVTLMASGTVLVTDVDSGEAELQPVAAGTAGTNGYGTFEVLADGSWTYSLNNGHAAVQALPAGVTLSDSLTVLSEDGTASQVISITITGTNGAASISGDVAGAVVEEDSLSVSGVLTVSDEDSGEAELQPVAAGTAGANGYGTFEVLADGSWTYSLNNDHAAVQALPAGVTLSDSLTVLSEDGTASQVISITITGTNGAASISGDVAGAVVEEDSLSVSGVLTVSDEDSGEAELQPVTAGTAGANGYGTFEVLADGSWTYSLNNGHAAVQALPEGVTLSDSLTVHSADGTASQVISITITGTNGAASISGDVAGAVVEEDSLSVSGVLTVSDEDSGEAELQPVTAG
ncbi:VCBS domain-containing protein, partial [Pseudomonas sp. CR3202]|uniref:VCBS domain-containing protein n=1 Tax=Pseudomonas sp. CR3202 TaxID=3351532 RepID=UPI003BF1969F